MYSCGTIELIIDKGKAKRKDLEYYPNWSLKITPRTKEWEEWTLKEPNPCGGIIITPKYDDIKKVFKEILIHEFQVDQITERKKDFSKWKKFIKELSTVIEQLELNNFEDGIPEKIRKCKKEVNK